MVQRCNALGPGAVRGWRGAECIVLSLDDTHDFPGLLAELQTVDVLVRPSEVLVRPSEVLVRPSGVALLE